MRIVGGKFRGSNLYIASDKNTRPLKDLVRESIFNLINHSKKFKLYIENSNILDLYSGTGSFGLECLSRQANYVYFVENKKSAFNILEKNIEKLKLKKKNKKFLDYVYNFIKKLKTDEIKFDIIFCDPPFKSTNIYELIEIIHNKNILDKNGIVILHRNKKTKEKFPSFVNILDERIYGISKIIFANFLI